MTDYIIKPGTVIEVTDKHIDEGRGTSCSSCAVSLAIKEHVPAGTEVFTSDLNMEVVYNRNTTNSIKTPAHVGDFINRFDSWKRGMGPRPDPISFEMPKPWEAL